jgi:hypothetical protein
MNSDLSHQSYLNGSYNFNKFYSTLDFPRPVEFVQIVIDSYIYKFGEAPSPYRVVCTDKDLSNQIGASLRINKQFDIFCDGKKWQFQAQYKYYDKSVDLKALSSKDLTNVLCVNCQMPMLCLGSSSDIFVVGSDDLCYENKQRKVIHDFNLQESRAIRVASNLQLQVKAYTIYSIPEISNISAQVYDTNIVAVNLKFILL